MHASPQPSSVDSRKREGEEKAEIKANLSSLVPICMPVPNLQAQIKQKKRKKGEAKVKANPSGSVPTCMLASDHQAQIKENKERKKERERKGKNRG